METEDFKKILAENKAHFIERIRKERGISHLRYVCEYDYSEFPFLPEEYYEQKWFESYFDFFVREYLINDSLKEALDSDYGFDNIIVWPPRKSIGLVTGYNNHEFEEDHPIEFYIEGDEGKIGFRYTGMPYDEDKFESCFFADDSEYCLEQLVILSFEGFASHYGKYNIIGMSFESFFDAYFNSEMYQLFYEMVSGSIKEAKDIIAIKTIPQMTSKYLTTYRFVVEKRFRNSEADNYYVYKGENPNNYIKFAGELWRIIKVESDGTIKIAQLDSDFGEFVFDDRYNGSCPKDEYNCKGFSNFETSRLKDTMMDIFDNGIRLPGRKDFKFNQFQKTNCPCTQEIPRQKFLANSSQLSKIITDQRLIATA